MSIVFSEGARNLGLPGMTRAKKIRNGALQKKNILDDFCAGAKPSNDIVYGGCCPGLALSLIVIYILMTKKPLIP